jgi:hypothetical protein
VNAASHQVFTDGRPLTQPQDAGNFGAPPNAAQRMHLLCFSRPGIQEAGDKLRAAVRDEVQAIAEAVKDKMAVALTHHDSRSRRNVLGRLFACWEVDRLIQERVAACDSSRWKQRN